MKNQVRQKDRRRDKEQKDFSKTPKELNHFRKEFHLPLRSNEVHIDDKSDFQEESLKNNSYNF